MKKRKVYSGEVHHVYQRTLNKGVIFYSVKDYLVFFTIYCSYARARGIQVLSLCPMPDHIHQVARVESAAQLADFIQNYTRLFAREWNLARKKKGSLIRHPFGSASKQGNKKVRTTLAYCNNNPVERQLVQKAEDYRWNFLAYYQNKNPYSPPLNMGRATKALRTALKKVQELFYAGDYLRYSQLDRMQQALSPIEWRQLADYIIGLWNVIDYEQAIGFYGSFEAMIRAFHDNTGSEYEINEEFDPYSDAVYADCIRLLQAEKEIDDVFEIPTLPLERKEALRRLLKLRTSARNKQICKFLHLPV